MSWRILPRRILGVGLLLIAALGVTGYLIAGREVKATITQQLMHRRQTLARAEASNITSFFQVFGESIAVFAQLSSMKGHDAKALQDMNLFVEQWQVSNLVGGVVLTDRRGIVQLNANVLGTADTGVSIADRDYFVWAKSQPESGKYFVGQPVVSRLGGTKGQLIVPVAAAVYQQGTFVGVLAASVKLKLLTEHYLALIKVSDETHLYLTDSHGQLLYSNSGSDTVDSSIFQLFPSLEDKFNTYEEGTLLTSERLVAYSPILLVSQSWWLVMVSPIQDIMDFMVPIYIRQVAILLLVTLTMLLFGVLAVRDNQTKKLRDSSRI